LTVSEEIFLEVLSFEELLKIILKKGSKSKKWQLIILLQLPLTLAHS
jgi:hypothetical protein